MACVCCMTFAYTTKCKWAWYNANQCGKLEITQICADDIWKEHEMHSNERAVYHMQINAQNVEVEFHKISSEKCFVKSSVCGENSFKQLIFSCYQ